MMETIKEIAEIIWGVFSFCVIVAWIVGFLALPFMAIAWLMF